LLIAVAPNHPGRARADALVTLCRSDDQAGPGTNFSAAIAAGGTISFNCPGHPALQITHVHVINRPTGDGRERGEEHTLPFYRGYCDGPTRTVPSDSSRGTSWHCGSRRLV